MPAACPARFSGARDLIDTRMRETCLPSLAIAVAQDGEILWEEAFGWADREARIPATPHTAYSLASVSKPVCATGLMLLKAQGRLDLDRPLNDYLGEAKVRARTGDAAEATIRRVANHSSGLPLHWHFFPSDEPRRVPSRDETIRRYGNLITAPGERYQYSNLGYGLLDYVIERVSGQPFGDFMRRELFLPLGMTRSSVHVPTELAPYAAARYASDGLRLPDYVSDHPGASDLWSSAHDLARFGMFHLKARLPDQQTLLSNDLLDEMHAPGMPTGANAAYGIGWRVAEDSGGYVTVSHDGGMDGVNTTLVLAPDARLVIVALANAPSRLPFEFATEIRRLLLPGWAEHAERRPTAEEAATPAPFVAPKELLGAWRGTVETVHGSLPLSLWFQPDSDIHAQLGDQLKTLVNHAAYQDGCLIGEMQGDLGTEDANRRPYTLHLDLRLRGDRMNGGLIVKSPVGIKLDAALTHWTELRRDD